MAKKIDVRKFLQEEGINSNEFAQSLDKVYRHSDPFAETGLSGEEIDFKLAKEYDQGWLADVGAGLANSLILEQERVLLT